MLAALYTFAICQAQDLQFEQITNVFLSFQKKKKYRFSMKINKFVSVSSYIQGWGANYILIRTAPTIFLDLSPAPLPLLCLVFL